MAIAAVLILANPAGAAERGPYGVESGTGGRTLADGDRYVAWLRHGVVRVLDEQTRTTTAIPLPAECRPPGALGAGALVTICGRDVRVLDIATQNWVTVPATETLTGLFFADSVDVTAIGSVWIELFVEVGYHAPAFPAWVERATGRVIGEDPGNLRQYANLDAPALWTTLCAPLRRRLDPDYDEEAAYGSPYIGPTVAGNRALEYTDADTLVVRRCGSTRRTVMSRSRGWGPAFFAAGRATWIDGQDVRTLDGDPRGRGRVRTYDAVTGRRGSWPVPGAVNPNTWVVHTRRHIFIDKFSSGRTVRRYAVDL
jgi:hypothetical protein